MENKISGKFLRAYANGKQNPCPEGYHLVTFGFVDYYVELGFRLVPAKFAVDRLGLAMPEAVPA